MLKNNEVNTNKKLLEVYNGSEVIAGAGFTMTSNYLLPLLNRMHKEGILEKAVSVPVVQTIFSFKFSKENPFVTYTTIAERLGISSGYVKQAIADIKKAGLVVIEKAKVGGRVSAYNLQPLFNLLEKFITEFKYNNNKEVKIADLMNVQVVHEKADNDFSWSEGYEKKETKIVPASEEGAEGDQGDQKEEKPEVPEEVPVQPAVELPEKIKKVLQFNKIGEKGIEAVRESFEAFGANLHVNVFIEKIVHASNKKNFVAFYNTCINNAYKNNEKPTEAPTKPEKKQYTDKGKAPVRTEVVPDWLKEQKSKEAEEAKKKQDTPTPERDQKEQASEDKERKYALRLKLKMKYGKNEHEKYGVDKEIFAHASIYSEDNEVSIEEAIGFIKEKGLQVIHA